MTSLLENEEKEFKHLFDGSEWNPYGNPKILNLGVGIPGPDLLEKCCEIFKTATTVRLQEEYEADSMLFQYGPTSGAYDVRRAVAEYFTKRYNSDMKSEDLIITAGASQGLHFILSTLIEFKGYIFVDELTYMLALDSIKQFQTFTIVTVKLNKDGVDLEDLDEKIKARKFTPHTKEFWGMYFTIPSYHNPTGILFSAPVCQGIVQIARKYDILVTCDDVYNVLHYREARLYARLFSYDQRTDAAYRGNVISNSTFSKIIAPGIRVGWLEVPARVKGILDRSGLVNSGGCFNHYTSGILTTLFELNLAQTHINFMYHAYKERMLAFCRVFERYKPHDVKFDPPLGGFFVWVRLPEWADAYDLLEHTLSEAQIFFIPGSRFAVEEGRAKNCLRLSISYYDKATLIDGAERFCCAVENYLSPLRPH